MIVKKSWLKKSLMKKVTYQGQDIGVACIIIKNNKKLAAQIIVLVNYKKLKKVVLHIILLKNSQYFC